MAGRCMEEQKLINEKVLQRFVYETLVYGDKASVRALFPPKFQKYLDKRVRVIIPEYPIIYGEKQNKHLTDFRILFYDGSHLNIEVEWRVSNFNHGKDVYDTAYRGTNGFLLVINNDLPANSYIEKDNIATIDADSFSFWFLRQAKHIVDGTISNYLPQYQSKANKNWVILLPSAGRNGGDSCSDYLNKGRKKGLWAFRYSTKRPVMKNILDISAGDTVVFVYNFTYGEETRGREIYHHTFWGFTGLDILRVKKGYYCDFKDSTFESAAWIDQNESEEKTAFKSYMHYFQFEYPPATTNGQFFSSEITPINISNDASALPGWLEFIEQLRWSGANSGAPALLSDEAIEALYTLLCP